MSPQYQTVQRSLSGMGCLSVMFLLTACGSSGSSSASTQVAAKVGKDEISVHQIDQVLARAPVSTSAGGLDHLKRNVLERLIDQQLAVSQAIQQELHRTPEVVAQIDSARQDILARAYAQAIASNVSRPSDEEVRQYYKNNPALFSERRVYTMQELFVPDAQVDWISQLRRWASQGRSAQEVASQLRAKNVVFTAGNVTRGADQMPLEVVPVMAALSDGQSAVMSTPAGATFVQLMASVTNPVSLNDAKSSIERFLVNQRGSEVVAAQLKALREKTAITYQGEYAVPAAVVSSQAASATLATASAQDVSALK